MLPAFQFTLECEIAPGLVTLGKYDSIHACLTCGTTGGKVVIHNPHDMETPLVYLNINRPLTALHAGCLHASPSTSSYNTSTPSSTSCSSQVLLIGTETHLLAYNVITNADVFYKELPDGVTSLTVHAGQVIVGGNCALAGYNDVGTEVFWTVAGDRVTALASSGPSISNPLSKPLSRIGSCPLTPPATSEATSRTVFSPTLFVGSADYDLRSYQADTVMSELTEGDVITCLCPIDMPHGQTYVAYALANGTVGVYHHLDRLWRVKSKHIPLSLVAADLNGDGMVELVIGWQHGKVEGREAQNGAVLYTSQPFRQDETDAQSTLAGLVMADYRLDGVPSLLVIHTNGTVCGYTTDSLLTAPTSSVAQGSTRKEEVTQDEAQVQALTSEKAALLHQLTNLETNVRQMKGGSQSRRHSLNGGEDVTIPVTTTVTLRLVHDPSTHALLLHGTTNNDDALIHGVYGVETEANVFGGDSFVYHPLTPSSQVTVPLSWSANVAVSLQCTILVAARLTSVHFHVFEQTVALPKFAMFRPVTPPYDYSTGTSSSLAWLHPHHTSTMGRVTMTTPENRARLFAWLHTYFLLGNDDVSESLTTNASTPPTFYAFIDVRSGEGLSIDIGTSVLTLTSPHMSVCAELVQAMGHALELTDVASTADFPLAWKSLTQLLDTVTACQHAKSSLTADMAQDASYVKTLIIQAEEARLMDAPSRLKESYTALFRLNQSLMGEYTKRSSNHAALMSALKGVNQCLQTAARCRLGRPASTLITRCRSAIQSKKWDTLLSVLQHGQEQGSVAP